MTLALVVVEKSIRLVMGRKPSISVASNLVVNFLATDYTDSTEIICANLCNLWLFSNLI